VTQFSFANEGRGGTRLAAAAVWPRWGSTTTPGSSGTSGLIATYRQVGYNISQVALLRVFSCGESYLPRLSNESFLATARIHGANAILCLESGLRAFRPEF